MYLAEAAGHSDRRRALCRARRAPARRRARHPAHRRRCPPKSLRLQGCPEGSRWCCFPRQPLPLLLQSRHRRLLLPRRRHPGRGLPRTRARSCTSRLLKDQQQGFTSGTHSSYPYISSYMCLHESPRLQRPSESRSTRPGRHWLPRGVCRLAALPARPASARCTSWRRPAPRGAWPP